jgi:glycosyltransferase involved in cell wall biosynthesis
MISIVMTYHNRAKQLINTLWSIEQTAGSYPIEVIIVDDKSESPIPDVLSNFSFPINLTIRTEKKPYDHVSALNIGLDKAKGDIILINCAECLHVGNIIEDICSNFRDGMYMAYSTYSIDWELFYKICIGVRQSTNVDTIVNTVIHPTHALPKDWKDGDVGWYSHPEHNNSLMPFCAAISRRSMEQLGGYDERFSDAIGWDDHDFVQRVKNLGLKTSLTAFPYCVHQPHKVSDYSGPINNELFLRLQETEPNRIKPPSNIYYIR